MHPYAVITAKGDRKLLLINKRDRDFEIPLGAAARNVEFVDQTTKAAAPERRDLGTDKVTRRGGRN